MKVKFLFYGTSSLMIIVITLAALGSVHNMITQATTQLKSAPLIESTELQPLLNTYCKNDYECKHYQKDCNQCVNLLVGGFSLTDKCVGKAPPCKCVDNRCVIGTEGN